MTSARLTARQLEIADLVAKGHTGKEIAQQTGLSIRTVQGHVVRAADRLPGSYPPRYKLTLFVLQISGDID